MRRLAGMVDIFAGDFPAPFHPIAGVRWFWQKRKASPPRDVSTVVPDLVFGQPLPLPEMVVEDSAEAWQQWLNAVADQEAAVDFERTQPLNLDLGAGQTQRSTEALQRSPQAFSMALRSCLPGRPWCRLSAGSVPMRRWSAASARAFRLSAVSR